MSQSSRPLGPSPHQRSRPLGPSPHPPPPPLLLIGEGGVISLTLSPEDRGRGFIKGGGGLTPRSGGGVQERGSINPEKRGAAAAAAFLDKGGCGRYSGAPLASAAWMAAWSWLSRALPEA